MLRLWSLLCLAALLIFQILPVRAASSTPQDISGTAAAEAVLGAPSACGRDPAGAPLGLTVVNGTVTAASIINEIDGYAKLADTVGGLGGHLVLVTSTADYDTDKGETVIPGTLRQVVDRAGHSRVPTWIAFSSAIPSPSVIWLEKPLHIPSNTTIDGSCSDITIEGLPRTGLFYVQSSHNVIIDRLRFRKVNYVSGLPNAELGTALRLGGNFDGVAILHNELSECGDGCIDTTTGPGKPIPDIARVTVAFNYIHDHDKTMLFGTHPCAGQTGQCRPDFDCPAPHLFMTLQGNAFLRDAQRNPRVYGCAELHAFDNYIAFQPHARPNAKPSASYGIFVSNGARALIEHNVFVPLDRSKNFAVWTAGLPGIKYTPEDHPGSIALAGGPQAPSWALTVEHDPAAVPAPGYSVAMIELENLPPAAALNCVSTRAGRNGGAVWPGDVCAGAGLTP